VKQRSPHGALPRAHAPCSYSGEYMIGSITFRMHGHTFREQVFAALDRAILA
jgi:hypothetical protein